MSSRNMVLIMGNLTGDPEVRKTQAGVSVCNCRVALNSTFKRQDGTVEKETTYVDVSMWGALGETFARFHRKGDLCEIDARLRNEEWDDRTTGQRREKLKLVAKHWYFVGERKSAQEEPETPAF